MTFYIAKSTCLGYVGNSKIWISPVPCKIIEDDENEYCIKCYDLHHIVRVSKSSFQNNFEKIIVTDEFMKDFATEKYSKNKIWKIITNVIPKTNDKLSNNIKFMIDKCFQDAYTSAGENNSITIKEYTSNSWKNKSNLKRYSPIFNRRSRNSCVVDERFDEKLFQSDPKPIGIRKIDYATKQEQNAILKQLIRQLFGFINMPKMPIELKQYLDVDDNLTHKCKYCFKEIDIMTLQQKYSEKSHTINLCHDDPKLGSIALNLYWGHTTCNREQGGFSQIERIQQTIEQLKILYKNAQTQKIPNHIIVELKELCSMIK